MTTGPFEMSAVNGSQVIVHSRAEMNRPAGTNPARLRLRPTRHVVPFPGSRASVYRSADNTFVACPLEQSRAFGPLRARCPRSQDTPLDRSDDGASRRLAETRIGLEDGGGAW